jgi:TolB protein
MLRETQGESTMSTRTDRARRSSSIALLLIAAGGALSACSSGVDPVLRDAQARMAPVKDPVGATGATGGTGRFEPFGVSSSGTIALRSGETDMYRAYDATPTKTLGTHAAPAKTVIASAPAPQTSAPMIAPAVKPAAPQSVALNTPAPTNGTMASDSSSKASGTNPAPAAQINPESISPVAARAHAPAPEAPRISESVMARAMRPGSEGNTNARGAAVNVVQVSFALEGADFDPDVSSDGRRIVFASTQHRPTADIYIKDVEGRTVTQLTTDPSNDIMPRLSPDGSRIAFASDRAGVWNIYVMPVAGGRAIQITGSGADDLHPSWSPDGTRLVFSRMGQMSGQWEMWVTDVSNNGVSKFIGYGLFPEWCPVAHHGPTGGDLIAFQKSRERGDRSFGLWTLEYKDGQAGNTTEIASSPNAACINPTWSRDGQWLAFSTVPNASDWAAQADARPTQADLWMVDLAGSNRINLTSGLALNLMPRFGPSDRLFFVSDRGGTDNLWMMDTSEVVSLAALNGNPTGKGAVASRPALEAPKARPTPPQPEVAGAHEEAPGESGDR